MKTKAERRVRHTTDLKRGRRDGDTRFVTKSSNRETVVSAGSNVYKKINLENQQFYVKLSTRKEE
jgi:hypothetical protein